MSGRKKTASLSGLPEHQLNRVEAFKKMCRMLEVWRRNFLSRDWQEHSRMIPEQQYSHLMMIRFSLPCNLARIMQMAGLTSAGASIFVNKMVKMGILERLEDPVDRRNVIVNLTPQGSEIICGIENRLNDYIFNHFEGCSAEELETLEKASRIICRKLDAEEK